jgi:Yip1 domain
MTETMSPGAAGASDHLFARLAGVIFSPRQTFTRLTERPRWLGALALISVLMAAGQFALLSTEKGQEAMVDQQVRQAERWSGGAVTDQQYQMYERMAPYNRYIVGGTTLVVGPVVTFIVAGILLGVFNALLGGSASYKQVLAIVAHSGAVNLLQMVFVLPLNYVRGSMANATNLGVFVQFLDDTNPIARFLGMMDVFIIWSLIVMAIGLAVVYRRKTAPVFWSLMGVYVVIALVVTGVMMAVSGGA